MQSKYKSLLVLFSGFSYLAWAHAPEDDSLFDIIGTTQKQIRTSATLPDGSPVFKTITLHKILPSQLFLDKHNAFINSEEFASGELDYSKGIIPFSQSPGAVDLGMTNVPVLDQGSEGTCVTFSTTAAMDALLEQGDFISQQCSLELDLALLKDYWIGARYPSQIIEPLQQFGLVQQGNCNHTYPSPFGLITLSDYASITSSTVNAKSISYQHYSSPTLSDVKNVLNAGHRMLIGFSMSALPAAVVTDGFNMTIDGVNTSGGLWACQQPSSQMNYCTLLSDGHEVVVIGYDDTQQLLKIRNSWGTDVGDNGDYYMTYTYFNAMNGDGTEIYL